MNKVTKIEKRSKALYEAIGERFMSAGRLSDIERDGLGAVILGIRELVGDEYFAMVASAPTRPTVEE